MRGVVGRRGGPGAPSTRSRATLVAKAVSTSGAGFLDDEAMDAFRRAAPFVNPPPQLIDKDGLIHFTFSFIFELSGRTNTKVFHYD